MIFKTDLTNTGSQRSSLLRLDPTAGEGSKSGEISKEER